MFHRSTALFLAGTAIFAISGTAHAQDNPAAAPSTQTPATQAAGDQEEIVITAQKRSERLLDVPQSVSAISGDSLASAHAQRLSDYLTRVPSANIVESQPGNSRIVLRGLNTSGASATVATYIDETPFGSATGLANGAVLAPDLDPFDLERVEVLRGPQGTLYGANSLGGLVKYVTVAPDTNHLGGAAELTGEDVSHGDFGWSGRAAGNLPIASDVAAVRASVFYRDDAGYIDDPNFGDDVNEAKFYGGRVSLLVKPTPELSIRASVLLQDIRSDATSTVDVDPITLKPAFGKLTHKRTLEEPNDIDYRIYNATIDYDFGPVTLVSSTSFGTLDQTQVQDATGIYGPLLGGLGVGVDQGMDQNRFSQEVRLASSGSGPVEWTAGGFYTKEKNRLQQNLFAADPVTRERIPSLDGLFLIDLPSRYREYAGFANVTWHISDQFDLTGGGRYSHNKQSVSQETGGIIPPPDFYTNESSDSVFTYAIAPMFKPSENTRIYARVAKGYRPGGPNLVSPLAAPDTVPRQFDPDTATNYEIGVKTQTDDHLLSAEVTAFLINWKNIQLLETVEQLSVNTNGGKARSAGLEFNFGLNPAEGLSLYANGSWVNAELTEDTSDLVGGDDGDPLPYNPKWQSTIGAEYEHPLSDTVTGRVGLSWHYTGSRHGEFNARFPYGSGAPQTKLSAFSQVDFHAGVDVGRFRVDAFARNLTDSRGIMNLGGSGTALEGNVAAAVVRPRSFGLSLGVRY